MHLKCKNNGNNQFLKLNFEYLLMLNHFYKLLFMMTFFSAPYSGIYCTHRIMVMVYTCVCVICMDEIKSIN